MPELQPGSNFRRRQLFVEPMRKRVVGFGERGIDAVAGYAGVAEVHAVGGAGGHAGDDFHAGEAGMDGVGDGGDHVLAQG